jgi:hypothetical protein
MGFLQRQCRARPAHGTADNLEGLARGCRPAEWLSSLWDPPQAGTHA